MISKDVLWKGAIEDFFEDFLHYFFSEFVDEVDFDRSYEFLDKELEQLSPDSYTQHKFADKLVKFYLKSGLEKWVLCHIEVQGYVDHVFPDRMFIYYYRILDKYGKPVAAIAIYTDDRPSFHPRHFENEFWDTRILYEFRTFKVLNQKPEDFAKSPQNPFSIILETVWIALQKGKLVNKLELKLKIVKKLFEKGFPKWKIERLFNFISYYIDLDKDEEKLIFENRIQPLIKKSEPMGIMEAIEQELKRQAKEEGMKEGIEEGMEKGKIEAFAEIIFSLNENGMEPEQIAALIKRDLIFVSEILARKNRG